MARIGLEAIHGEALVWPLMLTASEKLARAVITACRRHGVAEFVICPGSRDSPIILEIIRSGLRAYPFFDERAAAFFALGRAIALERPVAVVTTSGTAVAELYPAVVEALYQRVPLLCLTADRPAAFRGSGAPQSIEQPGMFCLYATASWDVKDESVDLSAWDQDGPAHLNVCLTDPLLGERPDAIVPPKAPAVIPSPTHDERGGIRLPRPDVIVLGAIRPGRRARVKELLRSWQCPILADAMSGLREDKDLQAWMIQGGERSLKEHAVRNVLRIGGVPTFRFWRDLEHRAAVSVWSVECHGFRGLGRDAYVIRSLDGIVMAEGPSSEMPARDQEISARLRRALHRHRESEPSLIQDLATQIPDGAGIFLGNSLPVREWNLAAPYTERAHGVWANRGANGIDGNLATFFGWATDRAESWGVFGDLTTLYDLNAPWILPHLPAAKRRIVVVNNGGGRIFARLPGLADLPAPFKAFTESEHHLKFEAWAKLWNLDYLEWRGGPLPPLPDHVVIELVPSSEATEAFWKQLDTP